MNIYTVKRVHLDDWKKTNTKEDKAIEEIYARKSMWRGSFSRVAPVGVIFSKKKK